VVPRELVIEQEDGGMNGLELLKEDHQKMQGLFEQVKAAENERQRKQLYKKIKAELQTHTYIEENVLGLGQSLEAAKKEFGKKTRAKAVSSR
jgi:hypothetical protein